MCNSPIISGGEQQRKQRLCNQAKKRMEVKQENLGNTKINMARINVF